MHTSAGIADKIPTAPAVNENTVF